MKTAILALTKGGEKLANKIADLQSDSFVDTEDLAVAKKFQKLWQEVDAIVCIMATGIVVRCIGKLCKDKKKDPCVVVLDEKGRFVISLLSGHMGGGNLLTKQLAEQLGAQAVITTASDVTGHTALDLWAVRNGLAVADPGKLTEKSAKLVNTGVLNVFSSCSFASVPKDFNIVSDPEKADVIVTHVPFPTTASALVLRPPVLLVGLGCNRGTGARDFEDAVTELFVDSGLSLQSIVGYASIDIKNDEQGMLDFVSSKGKTVQFYTKEELNSVDDVSSSDIVFAATGAKGVAEPAALLASVCQYGPGKLIVRKRKWKDVTVAVAMKQIRLVV